MLRTAHSYTSLFSAVWARSLPCVKMLLSHGASVAKINNEGNTGLDEAFEVGDKDIIEYLLDHHAGSPADHIQGTDASLMDIQRQTVAIPIAKAILQRDEEMALQLVNSRDSASSQSDVDIALRTCSLFNVPSLVTDLLEKGASLMATAYNKRTPLHFAAKCNSVEMTKVFIERGAIVQAVDISGCTPLDLSLSKGLANIETTRYLVEHGALATQSGTQDKTLVAGTKLILEGRWESTYTYSTWKKGDVDSTALSIQFDPNSIDSKYPFWKCNDRDDVGPFEVLGHVLTNNTIRFLKLYKSVGWLYLGVLDADMMIIRGTWGSSMTLRHGSFDLKKVEV